MAAYLDSHHFQETRNRSAAVYKHRSVRPTLLLMCQDKSDLLKTRVAGGLNKSRRPGTAGLFRLAVRLLVFTRHIHAALRLNQRGVVCGGKGKHTNS